MKKKKKYDYDYIAVFQISNLKTGILSMIYSENGCITEFGADVFNAYYNNQDYAFEDLKSIRVKKV